MELGTEAVGAMVVGASVENGGDSQGREVGASNAAPPMLHVNQHDKFPFLD